MAAPDTLTPAPKQALNKVMPRTRENRVVAVPLDQFRIEHIALEERSAMLIARRSELLGVTTMPVDQRAVASIDSQLPELRIQLRINEALENHRWEDEKAKRSEEAKLECSYCAQCRGASLPLTVSCLQTLCVCGFAAAAKPRSYFLY